MALKIGDRVRENTSSTGVGGLSLTGAPAGFQRFSAVLASGDTTYYTLEENDKFEVGIGTYGSNNLERTTILSSSNSGNKISLGGSGVVFITYPADRAVIQNENTETVVTASGIIFSDNTSLKTPKLVALSDVNLSGTPADTSIFDINITNKSLAIGDLTGATNSNNIIIGYGAASGITTSSDSVVIGSEASTINKTGQRNVHVGAKAGPVASDAATSVYDSVALGYSAGNKMRHESIAIGYQSAKDAYEIGFIGIGYQAGDSLGSYSTVVGYQAGNSLSEDYAIALGYRAGYNGAGESSVWIGQGAGTSSTGSTKSIGIGKNAGKSSSGNECIYIGEGAGTSNSDNNLIFVGNGIPSSNGTLIKGDMDAKRIAIGVADVTLDDTLFVGINSANDEGFVVKAAASQVSNLTSWKDNSDNVLASVDRNGIISGHGIHATGNGIEIASLTPASTSNRLYNVAGNLYFNGSQLASAGGASPTAQYASGIAVYASGQAIANESDIVATSGIAAYASGHTLQGVTDNGAATTNSITITNNNITASSGLFDSLDMTPLAEASYPAHQEGVIFYDVENHTLSLYNDEADVTLQLGQEQFLRVRNNTGTTITNGTAVLITGSHGNSAPTISGAIATSESFSQVVGLATHDIEDSSFGYVTTYGIVRNVDTSQYSDGDEIFLSATQIGSGVNVSPTIPNYKVTIGHVIRSHGSNGSVLVQIGNAKLGGGDLKSEAELNLSGVPFVTTKSDTTAGGSQTDPLFIFDSGNRQLQLGSGLQLLDGQPSNTTNVLYNHGGTLKFNGSAIGGGDVTTSQLNYVSGIAVYASGHVHDDLYVSGVANYASGQAIANESDITALLTASGTATSLVASSGIASYASGQAISNQGNITALLTASGTATSLISTSGVANYASGQAIVNEGDIIAVSGIAAYASGVGGGGGDVTTAQLNYVSGIAVYSSGLAITNEAEVTYASGLAITNEGRVNYASGQAISNQSNITALNTASGIATSLLAVSGTATSLVATSGIATYASGQAIANESDIVATSGISAYASGLAITNEGRVNYASGQAIENESDLVAVSGIANYASGQINVTTDGTAEASKALVLDSAKSFTGVKNGRFSEFDSFVYSTGVSVGNSGVLIARNTPDVTTDTLYNIGGTLYFNGSQLASAGGASAEAQYASGQAIENESDIVALLTASGTATSLVNTSGVATYASGQAISNQGNITALLSASGTATSLIASSGIATYASGQAISNQSNITALNTASGIATSLLEVSGTATSLVATSGIATYASGQAISNQSNITALLTASGTATSLVASSGIATYASGQAIANESDILATSGIANYASGQVVSSANNGSGIIVDDSRRINIHGGTGNFQQIDLTSNNIFTPKMVFTGSGVKDTPVTLKVLSSHGAVNTSGTALSFEGTQGQLFGITDNLSSGDIFSVSDITGLPLISADASGDVKLGEYGRYVGVGTGIPLYGFDVSSSGQFQKGFVLSNYVPAVTTNTLYNEGGTLKFNGSAVGGGGGDVSTAQLNYVSGIAVYGSGQSTSLNTASGIATSLLAVSGTATSLIATSGTATSLIASSGIATYASGQAIANESDIVATSGISAYASGLAITNEGRVSYASGQAIANEGDLVAVSGIAAYASGVSLTVKEADNNPNVANVRTIVVSNGTLTDNGAGQVTLSTGGGGGGMTNFTLAGDGGSNQTIADGNTLTVAGGNGITTAGAATDTVSIAVDAAQTTITSLLATDIKIGEDNETKIDFETADEIHFYANNVEQVYLADNIFGPQSDGDVDLGSTSVRWKDAYVDSITVTGEIDGNSLDIEGDADINGTTNLDAVDIDGNVQIDGTVTVGVDDTGKDVKFYGATSGSYLEWDESEDRLNLVGAAYVQEAVPANDTPTAEDATVTLDLKKGNFHNISLGQNVTKFEFINAKRGQRFILRITQHASSAKTVAWTDVDYTTGGAAATVRWAGNVVPTMSTSTSHTDVYGFLCTNNAGSNFDGFIIGQDLPD